MRCSNCWQPNKIIYESNFGDRLCEECGDELIYESALMGYIHPEDSKEYYLDDDITDIPIFQKI